MTAETLKPFITTLNVEHRTSPPVNQRRQHDLKSTLAIAISLIGFSLAVVLMGFMIWNTMRVRHLQAEVKSLNKVIESMQKRLGLNYLDDLNEFEKEYTNALIDNPNTLVGADDDDEDDDDDDDKDLDDDESFDSILPDEYEEIDSYDDLIAQYNKYGKSDLDDEFNNDDDEDEDDEDDVSMSKNTSDNDNLYDDFEKYKDSKKKHSRRLRSVSHAPNGLPIYEESLLEQLSKNSRKSGDGDGDDAQKPTLRVQPTSYYQEHKPKRHIVSENADSRRTHLRPRVHSRRRKLPTVKSGESLISAKTSRYMPTSAIKPAAHFHLNRKVPNREAAIRVDSYPGDMYIGHPSWTNEFDVEKYFITEHGVLTVTEPGLYYIYAQVCYNNAHDQNGFVIFHGHKPFLQCLQTVPTSMPTKIHTCHTSGLIFLRPNETIHLRDFHSDRSAILKDTNNRSYFGLIKI